MEGTTSEPTTTGTLPVASHAPVAVYFVRDGKVGRVLRDVRVAKLLTTHALIELLRGPTQEDLDADLDTSIPSGTELEGHGVENGTAIVSFSEALDAVAIAQVVYTLTQFADVERVVIDGSEPLGRADLEEQTPAILVESPVPWEFLSSPLPIAGTANTFEATFQVEVVDGSGRIIGKRFVTATSGSGERGTFDASVGFRLDGAGPPYYLVLYELSAEDGSRINEVEIPLRLLAD